MRVAMLLGLLGALAACSQKSEHDSASRWYRSGHSMTNSGVQVNYIDIKSVVDEADSKTVWLAANFVVPANGLKKILQHFRIDCQRKRYQLIEATGYGSNGSVDGQMGSTDWMSVVPGTAVADAYNVACSGSRDSLVEVKDLDSDTSHFSN